MNVGDRVFYLGEFKADIVGIRSNGIIIEFWGRGLQDGQLLRRRVAAKYLEPR